MTKNESKPVAVKVWDLPTRVFHWALVIGFIVMFASAKTENFDVHIFTGKTLVGLIIARICWGFWGSSNSKFSSLLFKPRQYASYISKLFQRTPSYELGHSPIGSIAVIVILAALITQLSTGLIASDIDGLVEGPFAYYVSYELSRWAGDFHVSFQDYLIALVVLHILANLYYFVFKKENLIKAMFTGVKLIPQNMKRHQPSLASTATGIITATVVAVIVTGIFWLYG